MGRPRRVLIMLIDEFYLINSISPGDLRVRPDILIFSKGALPLVEETLSAKLKRMSSQTPHYN